MYMWPAYSRDQPALSCDRSYFVPWVMATVKKGLSDRQKRRIRASIAKRLVECDVESLRQTAVPSTADSQTVTGCENDPCTGYKSEDDDHGLLPSSEDSDHPSIEDDGTDFDRYEPLALLSESGDNLTTPDDTDSADSESLSSMDLLDGSMSLSELSSSELSGEENELGLNQPTREALFPGGQLSNHEFCVALLSVFQKHSLTYAAVDDLLQLFRCVLPAPSSLPTSQHMLLKELVSYNSNTILHRCCGSCCQLLSSGRCPRRECRASNSQEATFVEVKIDSQLKEKFMGKAFPYTLVLLLIIHVCAL